MIFDLRFGDYIRVDYQRCLSSGSVTLQSGLVPRSSEVFPSSLSNAKEVQVLKRKTKRCLMSKKAYHCGEDCPDKLACRKTGPCQTWVEAQEGP